MKPSILIISESSSKNLGDQAIARSLSEILCPFFNISKVSFSTLPIDTVEKRSKKNENHKVILQRISRNIPNKTKARIRWHLLGGKRAFLKHFSASIKESNLVIMGGGQLIKNNTALFCEKLSLISGVSRAQSIPTALIGVGVDKNMKFHNWRVLKNVISEVKFIILRDLISRDRIRAAINLGKECSVVPDLAFALKAPKVNQTKSDRGVSIAINIMNIEAMLSPVDHVKKPSANSVISSLCEIVKITHVSELTVKLFTSGANEDLHAAKTIKNEVFLRTGIDLAIFHPSSLDDFLDFLGDVDSVIATRLHAGILAYISGCNPVCVNWDDKVEGVWSAIHQRERVIAMSDLERENAAELILKRLQGLAPASQHSLDELAEEISICVLEPIRKIIACEQTSITLKT